MQSELFFGPENSCNVGQICFMLEALKQKLHYDIRGLHILECTDSALDIDGM